VGSFLEEDDDFDKTALGREHAAIPAKIAGQDRERRTEAAASPRRRDYGLARRAMPKPNQPWPHQIL
jgi:hypothetical protein